MAQLIDEQPAVPLARMEPPAHPALPQVRAGRLRFRPAPTGEAEKIAAPARRRRRRDWLELAFEAGWMALILACGAECIYRLIWAVQP